MGHSPNIDVNAKLWRYMDMSKFISMLEDSSLYFSRIDMLGDPFEASYPIKNENFWDEEKVTKINSDKDPKRLKEMMLLMNAKIRERAKIHRYALFVNCWHKNENESAAMWKIYAKTNESICIVTSFGKLRNCLPDHIQITPIQYIDYENDHMDDWSIHAPYMFKRKSFEYENEIRAIFEKYPKGVQVGNETKIHLSTDTNPKGIKVKINLNDLIEFVYISPSSPTWFLEMVIKLCIRYGIEKIPQKSHLDKDPFW